MLVPCWRCILNIKSYFYFQDNVSASNWLDKYISEDPTFDHDRQCNFLKEAIEAVKEKNENNFKAAVTKLKNYSEIDKWRINMFTKVLEVIKKENNEDDYL